MTEGKNDNMFYILSCYSLHWKYLDMISIIDSDHKCVVLVIVHHNQSYKELDYTDHPFAEREAAIYSTRYIHAPKLKKSIRSRLFNFINRTVQKIKTLTIKITHLTIYTKITITHTTLTLNLNYSTIIHFNF